MLAVTTLLPAVQRGQQQGAGRLDAADHLDDEVDVVARDQRGGVGGEQRRVDGQVAVPLRAADGDADQLERRADPGGEVVGLLVQQPDDLGADDAAAEQGNPDRLGQVGSVTHVQSQQVVLGLAAHEHPGRARRATATTGGRGTWL